MCHLDTSIVVAQQSVAGWQGQVADLIKPEAPRMTPNIVTARKTHRRLVSSFEVDHGSLDSVS